MSGTSPLAGLRVLDFTQNLPGPYTSFMLASLGAEVIKLEPPRGDPARHIEPFFELLNRGKKSVVLDLRDPAAAPHLEALVKSADVLLEGFRPGVMARLGCDAETARAWKPELIYCSISAFGQQGPRQNEPGHDLNIQALTGICHLERTESNTPRGALLPIADLSSSLVAVASICAALANGKGAQLDISMADAALSWAHIWGEGIDLGAPLRALPREGLGKRLATRLAQRVLLPRLDRQKLYALPHYSVFRCRDGRHIALGIVDEKHFWKKLCEVLALGRLARFGMASRTAGGPLLRSLIALQLRRRPLDHWMAQLVAAGVPATPCLSPAEAARETQFIQRGLVDENGRIRAPLPGARHLEDPAPRLGEHTDVVLGSLETQPR